MLTLPSKELSSRLTKAAVVSEINGAALQHAAQIFNDFKGRGVILNGSFEDDAWSFTNELKNVGIRFEVEAVADWIGCTPHEYAMCVKTYIAFQIGRFGLLQLQGIARLLCSVSSIAADDACQIAENISHVKEFLGLIPAGCAGRDAVIEALEERASRVKSDWKAQRVLADFRTYLRFDEVISRFWDTADERRRLIYFPLYFWWKLTAILPLRPTELLLTPRDCLSGRALSVRRTRLKGKGGSVNYSIDGDYDLHVYEISAPLASELRDYIAATDTFKPNEIDTLLVPVNSFFGGTDTGVSRYYTYSRLRMCLRDFYDEVVTPSGADIGNITLGDTRHLAMANLIISGGSPSVCRELAVHADIGISSHYYANISNLVECATNEHLRKSKGGAADFVGKQLYPLARPAATHSVRGGWCDSMAVIDGDVSECLKVSSSSGNIGDCACCPRFWPDEQGVRLRFYDKELGKQRVDADTAFLLDMVDIVRRGLGHTEDVGSAILRLQRSCDHYIKCILENIENGKA